MYWYHLSFCFGGLSALGNAVPAAGLQRNFLSASLHVRCLHERFPSLMLAHLPGNVVSGLALIGTTLVALSAPASGYEMYGPGPQTWQDSIEGTNLPYNSSRLGRWRPTYTRRGEAAAADRIN